MPARVSGEMALSSQISNGLPHKQLRSPKISTRQARNCALNGLLRAYLRVEKMFSEFLSEVISKDIRSPHNKKQTHTYANPGCCKGLALCTMPGAVRFRKSTKWLGRKPTYMKPRIVVAMSAIVAGGVSWRNSKRKKERHIPTVRRSG